MPHPDTTNLFLLPFAATPSCKLRYGVGKTARKRKATKHNTGQENEDEDVTPSENSKNSYYEFCDVTRTQTDSLLKGSFSPDENPPKTFRFALGDFVLLRPNDNSFRPPIGKIISFYSEPRNKNNYLRVQWFYRGEDLCGPPPVAVSEDEVFETGHFDKIEVDCIVGRCKITSYPAWLLATEKQLPDASNGEKAEGPHDGNHTELGEKAIREEYDSDEDAASSFMDNYVDVSLRYFCRRYYDPATHIFVNSQYEYPNANPQEEIAIQRGLEAQAAEDSDYEAEDGWLGESDDGADSDRDVDVEELEDLQDAAREKQRGKKTPTAKKRKARRHKGESAQFALPVQLGNTEILPCRDVQKAQVRNFLLEMINDPDGERTHGSRCMYISGVPGTGKTATVREVLYDLQRKRSTGEVGNFEVIEVNAMSLPDPALIYSELYAVVTGNRGIAPMHAAQLLEKQFSDFERDNKGRSGGRKNAIVTAREQNKTGCVVVMLDEMDILLSRKQKVLYDLLEWPSRKEARLAVIGIANTMDLPERMLPRLASRIGLNRLCYPPYTSSQITEILHLTLKKDEVVYDESAIRLCATKVGAVSGDVRRAFELCRRAAEIMAEDGDAKSGNVTAGHVNKAIQAVAGNARLAALEQLSLFEKLVLVSSLYIARSEGSFNLESMCSMEAVCEKAVELALAHRETFKGCSPSTFELQEACWRLAGQRLVLIEKAIVPRLSRVIVNLSADDCAFGLRMCEFSTSILTGQLRIKAT